jgi:hypothetical protein
MEEEGKEDLLGTYRVRIADKELVLLLEDVREDARWKRREEEGGRGRQREAEEEGRKGREDSLFSFLSFCCAHPVRACPWTLSSPMIFGIGLSQTSAIQNCTCHGKCNARTLRSVASNLKEVHICGYLPSSCAEKHRPWVGSNAHRASPLANSASVFLPAG